MNKIITGVLAFSLLLTTTQAWAQKGLDDEEDSVSVVTVRKRYFLKGNRTELNLNGSWVGNDSYVRSLVAGGSLGYHFSEGFFMEAVGGYFINYDTSNTDLLQNQFGITPDTDDINYYGTVHVGWSPIYGKLNFMSKKVVYFDTSFYTGLGGTDANVSGLAPHATFGLAQRFVFNKSMALRFDIKDNVVVRDDTGVDSAIRHVVFVGMGLSFFFPLR